MLWSLAKVLLFFTMIACLTWGASILSGAGGGMRVALMGYEVTLGPLQAVLALLAVGFALWALFRIAGLIMAVIRFIAGDETALSRHFDRNRERRGLNALSEAILAQAAGENRVALARATKAQRLLDRPDVTNVIAAQAALALGETSRAEEAFRALLPSEKARFVGVRGLMQLKLEQGDTATALKLAEKAFALKPKNAETQETLLKLQTRSDDWKGARGTLAAQLKAGFLPKDVWRRRDALLALQEASELLSETASVEAQEAAIAANKASPDLIPAACMAARSYIAQGNPRAATRVLSKAWKAQPHPDLAAAFAEIVPDESPDARLERFRTLLDLNPTEEESRLLMAELKIATEDFPGAQRALGDLATSNPTTRVMTIMAAIERGMGAEDAIVRGWLARALTAPRGKQWVCGSCNAIHSEWVPVCDNCGGFDTLSWTEVQETAGPSATQTEMLPLIVGRPESAAASAVETTPKAHEVPEDAVEITDESRESEVYGERPDEVARRGAF